MIVQKQLIINSNQKMIELTEGHVLTKKKKPSTAAVINKVCSEYGQVNTEEDLPISKFELPFYDQVERDSTESIDSLTKRFSNLEKTEKFDTCLS